jgi:general secretion pathway protein N
MYALQSKFGSLSVWLLAFAALATIIGWETGWGRRVMPSPELGAAPAPQPVSLALLPDYQIEGGVAARRDTVERPAFIPTRRPAPAAVQEVPKPKMPRGQFTLTGTAVVDQKQIAFLRETAGGKARSVRAGETINGVVVAEVKPDRVKLTLGNESEELVLKVASGPRQTVQPPQPGAPGAPGAPGPAAPQPPQPPRQQAGGQPIAADTGAPMDSDASILERRRAARAALQAQQEAARAAGQAPPPRAPAAPGALAVPQASTPTGAAASSPDPAWNDVYRRMQQPRR